MGNCVRKAGYARRDDESWSSTSTSTSTTYLSVDDDALDDPGPPSMAMDDARDVDKSKQEAVTQALSHAAEARVLKARDCLRAVASEARWREDGDDEHAAQLGHVAVLLAERLVVVDFAVGDEHIATAGGAQRLRAALEIDNRQPRVTKRHLPFDRFALAIRSTVLKRRHGEGKPLSLQPSTRGKSYDPAHLKRTPRILAAEHRLTLPPISADRSVSARPQLTKPPQQPRRL